MKKQIDKILTGDKIRRMREALGLTREEFCQDESALAVRTLQRAENGECIPKLESILYIADRLCCEVSCLICYLG